MTEQGEKNLFYKQVLVLERSRRNDEPYTEYRSRVLQTYLEEELNRVKPTTFYFYPLGSVEPRKYMQLDYDKQAVFNKFIFMNAGLGNRAPSECGVRLKECIACRIMYNKYLPIQFDASFSIFNSLALFVDAKNFFVIVKPWIFAVLQIVL